MSQNIEDYSANRNLHDKLFEILVFLDRTCREQGLVYYLAYGTLLGAVRHKGFIPWDDDIDVWMPRSDFMKLLDYLRAENKDPRFVLNEGVYRPEGDRPSEFQMRILDTQTEISRLYANNILDAYLWIDIFALDTVPQTKKEQFLSQFKRKLLMYKIARCKTFLIPEASLRGKLNKLIYTMHNRFGMLKHCLDEEKKKNAVVKTLTRYEGCADADCEEYFSYAAVYLDTPQKCFFRREWFSQVEEVSFNGRMFYAPAGWDAVLKNLYNDYMTIPPEHQRVTHEVKER